MKKHIFSKFTFTDILIPFYSDSSSVLGLRIIRCWYQLRILCQNPCDCQPALCEMAVLSSHLWRLFACLAISLPGDWD